MESGEGAWDMILSVRDLNKSFGGLQAVDNANLDIRSGEIQCVIGPNGAGKSTFLHLIVRLQDPDSGSIIFRGEDITSLHPHEISRLGIGFKFQTPSVYERLSVQDNLRIPVQRQEVPDIGRRIDELLELTNLIDRRDDRAADLSHGEREWLEIAMTMGIDPELVLLDEPTAGMTRMETEATGEIVRDLIDAGKTVIVVEHDIEFVRQFSSQVSFMHKGEFLVEGTMSEIEANEDIQRIYLGDQSG